MVKFGVAATVTISVLQIESFVDCALFAPLGWAPRRCGVLDPLSSTPVSQRFWKVNKHVLSLHLDKFSVCAPMIKAAIISRGFICTSLTCVTSGTIRLATTGICASQNVVRIL